MGLFNSVITAGCSEIWFSVMGTSSWAHKRQFHSDEELMKSGNWKRRITPRKVTVWFLEADLSEPPCWDEPGLQEKGDRTGSCQRRTMEAKANQEHRLHHYTGWGACCFSPCVILHPGSIPTTRLECSLL